MGDIIAMSSISKADQALVEGFWKEFIDGYIFDDLNKTAKVGANYLVALGEMCYIDFLGKLMTGVEGSQREFHDFRQGVSAPVRHLSIP